MNTVELKDQASDVCLWKPSKKAGCYITACEPTDFVRRAASKCHCGKPVKLEAVKP